MDHLWVDFSEALEMYLSARDGLRRVGEGHNAETLREEMRAAAEHMDALVPRERECELAPVSAPLSNAVIARAEQLGVGVHDIRLSPVDPADLKGLVSVKN